MAQRKEDGLKCYYDKEPKKMIKHGEPPYLECSSKGDKRFSAFYARIIDWDNKSIEEIYQAAKVFEDGKTNLSWREAKGKHAINQEFCNKLYKLLWKVYLVEHHYLLDVLNEATGVSDIFGQHGHMCQATVLWNIKNEYK